MDQLRQNPWVLALFSASDLLYASFLICQLREFELHDLQFLNAMVLPTHAGNSLEFP